MKYSVLIADNDIDVVASIKVVCHKLGAEAVVMCNGREAVDLARERDLDLVIIGMGLDELDGIEAIQVIRMSEPDLPIIGLVDGTCATIRIDALRAGAHLVLDKPVDGTALTRAVRQLLALPEPSETHGY
jgi:DNA-binding response OmpR family regulator